jgi:hypothetical protein
VENRDTNARQLAAVNGTEIEHQAINAVLTATWYNQVASGHSSLAASAAFRTSRVRLLTSETRSCRTCSGKELPTLTKRSLTAWGRLGRPCFGPIDPLTRERLSEAQRRGVSRANAVDALRRGDMQEYWAQSILANQPGTDALEYARQWPGAQTPVARHFDVGLGAFDAATKCRLVTGERKSLTHA